VLISAELTIRGQVGEYAPAAIGDVGQRLVEQFAGNVEQLLATQARTPQAGPSQAGPARPGTSQARSWIPAAGRPRWAPSRPDKRAVAAAALLLAGGAVAAGALALAVWRHRHPEVSQLLDTPWYISHEGARHG
jgi:hypothetical protein